MPRPPDGERIEAYVCQRLRYYVNEYRGFYYAGHRYYVMCLLDIYKHGKMRGMKRKELEYARSILHGVANNEPGRRGGA